MIVISAMPAPRSALRETGRVVWGDAGLWVAWDEMLLRTAEGALHAR